MKVNQLKECLKGLNNLTDDQLNFLEYVLSESN